MTNMIVVGSIKEIYKQLRQEGIHISESTLRSWVKDGSLPVKYSGKKAILVYADVLAYLGINNSNKA